jgi:hypothetical protein
MAESPLVDGRILVRQRGGSQWIVGDALRRKGIIEYYSIHMDHLTPLGLAVRSYHEARHEMR